MGSPKHFTQSGDDNQGQYIDDWHWGAINLTAVSQYSDKFCIMANSIKTNSTKSLVISSKAMSLEKSVQKGAKAVTQPFKKLKKSLSTVLMPSKCSHSSTTVSPTDNEVVDPGNESSTDSQGDGSGSELSGFKPGSALSDPDWGQPTSLGPLGWSIMSLDGLVHPRKII